MNNENINQASEKTSYLRFFQENEENFFENFSIWAADNEITNKTLIFNYPKENRPLTGTSDHIVPSPESLPNLLKPYFHMATLGPVEGFRVIYSIIIRTRKGSKPIKNKYFTIEEDSLIILVIESKFLHPLTFNEILKGLYNRLSNIEQLLSDINNYMKITLEKSLTATNTNLLPFDISPAAEIGRFHQFLFSLFNPEQVLKILLQLLTGTTIFVTSIDTSLLCIGCFALLSLLYPLKWPNTFIPTLPKCCKDIVGSPSPFIIGIPLELFLHDTVNNTEVNTLLNLDFRSFKTDDPVIDKATNPTIYFLINKISDMISEELKFYKESGAFPAYRIQVHLWKFIYCILFIFTNLVSLNIFDPNLSISDLKISLANELLHCQKISFPNNSIQKLLQGSGVVNLFAEHITGGYELYIPDDFLNILKSHELHELLEFIHQQK